MTDASRRPPSLVDPDDYLTDGSNVVFHVLNNHQDPLFLVSPSCHYSMWPGGLNNGSSIMVHTEAVSVEWPDREIEKPGTLHNVFKHCIQKNMEAHRGVLWRAKLLESKETEVVHIVVALPPDSQRGHKTLGLVAGEYNDPERGRVQTLTATIGMFSVPSNVHVRLYGDCVEIPQPSVFEVVENVHIVEAEDGVITQKDLDFINSTSTLHPTEKAIREVLQEGNSPQVLAATRKKLTNELVGFSVDLFKAGTGKYDGEAAQTLRNIVQARLNETIVDTDGSLKSYQEVFLTKALVRLVGLGQFILDIDKHEYFEKRTLEKIAQMKDALDIPLHHGSKVLIVRDVVPKIVRAEPLAQPSPGRKADLGEEAKKARARIQENAEKKKEKLLKLANPDGESTTPFDVVSHQLQGTDLDGNSEEAKALSELWRTEPEVNPLLSKQSSGVVDITTKRPDRT